MKIALDYDGTYTRDPAFWNSVIKIAQKDGHEIAFVTKRHKTEPIETLQGINVYYMARVNKIHCTFEPDIWIDNNPFDITGYP